ncbi:MAG: RloB family protein [Intestinibacter sp.]
MAKKDRLGKRKKRTINQREPELGYYLIFTDTEETEKNYFEGLRDSIPSKYENNLTIKVKKTGTYDLVDDCKQESSQHPQYAIPWIVLDRDEVKNFDSLIEKASKNNINVGWSNPCIEIWFEAYFGKMPTYNNSGDCCRGFENTFKKNTGKKSYEKKSKTIYSDLYNFGNEEEAIKLAKQKYKQKESDGYKKPSFMNPCTTVYKLVEEIRNKIKNE